MLAIRETKNLAVVKFTVADQQYTMVAVVLILVAVRERTAVAEVIVLKVALSEWCSRPEVPVCDLIIPAGGGEVLQLPAFQRG